MVVPTKPSFELVQPAGRGRIFNSITETIGNTPLVRLARMPKEAGVVAEIFLKLEFFNPIGSVKDRIGVSMIEAMESDGIIAPEKNTLVEPTSGNTGIALAFAAAAKGYRLILVMPNSMSIERRKMLALLGAELVLTDATKGGMRFAIAKAREIAAGIPGAVIPQQFENPANPSIHRSTTAEEIWNDTEGSVDVVISGSGYRRDDHRRRPSAESAQAERQDDSDRTRGTRQFFRAVRHTPILSRESAQASFPQSSTETSSTRSSPSPMRRHSRQREKWRASKAFLWVSRPAQQSLRPLKLARAGRWLEK